MRLPLWLVVAPAVVVVLLIVAGWLALFRDDDAPGRPLLRPTDYAVDVPSPSGISFGLGGVVITSLGAGEGDGAVFLAKERGKRPTKIVELLPSVPATRGALPFLPVLGPTSAVEAGGSLAIVVSGDRDSLGTVLRSPLRPGAESSTLASIAEFWRQAGVRGTGRSAPFDMVRGEDGTLFVSDPAAGAVLSVTPNGKVSVYAEFGPVRPPDGPTFEAVPTGLALGPDGALYVALFSGEPYRPGRSRIYRLQDRDGDGDAADSGERTIAADRLSFNIDLAFGPDGQLYALEYATVLGGQPSGGRLWRLAEPGAELLANGLFSPMALAIDDRGDAYVAERDTGKVLLFRGVARPPEPAGK